MPLLHFVNWNVNGIRSIVKKDFLKDVRTMNPDVLCLQETKAGEEEVKTALELLPEYTSYYNSSKARKGYSGTAILTKEAPLNITYDMALEEFDQEGRVITAEFLTYFLVTVYTPNAGDGLARLEYRARWDYSFNEYVNWLKKRKPVIVCGDLNVAHKEIDIARPKENYNKSAGFTQREIDGFQRLLDTGFVDTFRHFHPDEVKYTYWNFVTSGRIKNIGWRIDYFLVNEGLLPSVKEAIIYNEYHGSDHCPVGLKVEI
ncbi:MAG: exodeoxyribonuclease III [Azospira oryzae]|jgi:exodeoxyribonuclease-3|nr:MAG: exodeoxyribonuclease III [Azospira oryzae]